jgi:hypothetical protein
MSLKRIVRVPDRGEDSGERGEREEEAHGGGGGERLRASWRRGRLLRRSREADGLTGASLTVAEERVSASG